jgi:SagB-type dehydrogenase family enzyme
LAQSDLDRVLIFHDATKHHPHRYAKSLGYLDWENQPDPFRRYGGAPLIPLTLGARPDEPAYDDIFRAGDVPAAPLDRRSISEFFECSLGLSAWKSYKTSTWALRCNPSSGNLHPTEAYLICGPIAGIADDGGVFHYAPKENGLELRHRFDAALWKPVLSPALGDAFLVGLSSVFWREAWKYGERAFRYCQHDVGHAIAALRVAAAMLGWRMWLIDIGDAELARLLGLDRVNRGPRVEWEHAEALVLVTTTSGGDPLRGIEPPRARPAPSGVGSDQASTDSESRLSQSSGSGPRLSIATDTVEELTRGDWHGMPNRLSGEHVAWDIIEMVADATLKPAPAPQRNAASRGVEGIGLGSGVDRKDPCTERTAREIVLRRRSATDFDGRTGLPGSDFFRMMRRLVPVENGGAIPWDTIGWSPRIHLLMFIHLVEGLRPGLYALVRDRSRVKALRSATKPEFEWARPAGCPDDLDLYFLLEADCRRAAAQLSLGQAIGGDSAFSFGMIAEFEESLNEFGPWFYRRLFWEAGMVGQTLYLEAEAAAIRNENNLRATGIGAYFDDAVHDVFGLTGHAFQDLYHFTIGGAVEDPRLATKPPYDEVITQRR